ncbi:MAG: hypothetical protein AUJ85_09255 [Elusimicrobia bacterium CG1_02_37_114]|nr:MAG: hypothetical protein AUJ85_09255 [Elusimicrobia bacterium CG1_02_37_114]PIV53950.1 MAG: hypothetical protein COS17_01205 [Elusimicrobia bacterium CG02_land_8_20_14_3_00_37_13]PIZ14056.1 MAG: hypothetical protein COY53_01625 [Elusimicrobia bacterium CG_4_10_14_0_8_um_filter_37_32]
MNITLLIIKLTLYIICIFFIRYFGGTETALLSISAGGLIKLKKDSSRLSKCLTMWEQEPNHIIASILIGTNLAYVGAGVIFTSLVFDIQKVTGLNLFVWVIPLIGTLGILIFGDILPKVYSRYNSEKVCLTNIKSLILFSQLTIPVSDGLVNIAESILKFLNLHKTHEQPFLTREELKFMLAGESSDFISHRGRKLITNVFSFGRRRIAEAMIPRSKIFAVNYNDKLENIIQQVIEEGYSRVPVYQDTRDNITGIIYTKDLIVALRNKELLLIDDLIRPTYFVPENASVISLLYEFKKGHHRMAIVVDEYGSTVGVVTIEDLVEEIVGEIYDEYDIREKTIIGLPDGSWIIRGSEEVDKINEELKLNLKTDVKFNTISGLISTALNRIPKIGEKIDLGNAIIEIIESDKRKVHKLKLKIK